MSTITAEYVRGPKHWPMRMMKLTYRGVTGLVNVGTGGTKRPLVDAGLVRLGRDWKDALPVIRLKEDEIPGYPAMVLEGWTRDPVIVALYREAVEAADKDVWIVGTRPKIPT